MSAVVLVCGNAFDGISDALTGPTEILVEGNRIAMARMFFTAAASRRVNPATRVAGRAAPRTRFDGAVPRLVGARCGAQSRPEQPGLTKG
jgi:hypothetical protein